MPYKKLNRLLDMPKVRVQRLTAAAANARVYSAVHSRKDFRGAIVTLKLVHGDAAEVGNLPTRFEVYGVEDSDDVAATRVLVVEKDLVGVTDWSGTMQIELDETHFGALIGKNADGTPKSLDYFQVAVSGTENEVYEAVIQLCAPWTKSETLLDELNV